LTIRDIAVAFGFEVDQKSVSSAESAIKGVKSMATKLLGAIGIGFSIAGIGNLAEAAADAEALESQFSQVFGNVEKDAEEKLNKIADDTGVLANRMKGSFTQIAAFAKTTGMEEADALGIADRAMVAVADSAAFYDKSIEDTTASLQSFLKGNFANDAALGLSCTETTRNAAANALYGKSFTDLSEAEKQLTLLQMVEDANAASGALGQAARESDTWTNQLGNLKQSLQDLKAAAGKGILKPAVQALKMLNSLTQQATAGITKLTAEDGLLTRSFNSLFSLVKKLKPSIDRMMQTLQIGASKGISMVKGVVDKLGGVDKALKLLAIVAGAFLLVMNWSKIVEGASTFIKLLSKMKGIFTVANLKILAIVAVVVLLALVVEDFINFLLGNDSVIGSIFDKTGIGAENARQAVFKAWNKIKEFLINVWDFIKQAAGMFVDTVKGFFEKHSESIRANFERAWGIIKTFLSGVWTFISQLAATLFGETEDSIDGSSTSTKDKLLAVWQAILDALSAVWDALYEVGSAIFNAIATVIETVFNWIQAFWNSWGSTILAWFKTLWDSIGGILNGFLDIIKGVANFISSVFTGDWEGAWNAIKDIFSGIWDVIVNIVTAVWETIKMLFQMALAAIKAVWEAIWNGIKSFFEGIWNGIVSFISGIWSTITGVVSTAVNTVYSTVTSIFNAIKSTVTSIVTGIKDAVTTTFTNIVTGISTTVGKIKDTVVNGFTAAIDWIKGLPSQALQWGSDIISGIADGIKGAISKVTDAVSGVADKIKSFLHFSVPDEGPLTDFQSWMPDFMGGLAEGIGDSEDALLDKVKGVASGISTLMQGATANVSTAASGAVSNTSNTTVTQNNTFNNSYSGSDTQAQKNVSKGMNKSAQDATTYMAKGLAYAR
jgi:phage-related protein